MFPTIDSFKILINVLLFLVYQYCSSVFGPYYDKRCPVFYLKHGNKQGAGSVSRRRYTCIKHQAITAKNLLKPGSRQGLMSRACREPGLSRSVVYFLHKIENSVLAYMSRYGTCENILPHHHHPPSSSILSRLLYTRYKECTCTWMVQLSITFVL